MKILITGSQGQLARELQLELAGAGKLLALGHNALNLADPEQIREQVRLVRPDLIINAAAYTAVDPAETHREQAFAVNARGPQVLAEEAARLGVPLIHYSTSLPAPVSPRISTSAWVPANAPICSRRRSIALDWPSRRADSC